MAPVQYSSMFTVEDIEMMAHLGYYDDERAKRQPISVTFRFYFPYEQACVRNDFGHFIDYQKIVDGIDAMIQQNQYRLIEFLTHEIYQFVRTFLDENSAKDAKLWVSLTKLKPDIAVMQGGAKFIYSDLPANAAIVHAC